MTFFAERTAEDSDVVEVSVTGGWLTVTALEPAAHLRHFWHQLGVVLDEIEHPKESQE